MSLISQEIQPLYDLKGDLVGIFISPALWKKIQDQVEPIIDQALGEVEKPAPEPMAAWEQLLKFWDFDYPVAMDVQCELCGNKTDDWSRDDPRLFRLKSANMAGLVAFECAKCKAKVVKKHFKDHILTEATPYQARKSYKFESERTR